MRFLTYYVKFDEQAAAYSRTIVETLGQAQMAASGLDLRSSLLGF
jgi:hypothetical protein